MPKSAPRIRRTPIPDDVSLVIRGDELNEQILRADATRFRRRFDAWGRYGVSALLASNDAEVGTLCETRLERFETVIIYRRDDLESLGVAVVPTFRTPHVTIASEDLESLVRALLTCDHRELRNPHFDG
jgi:hypothetical protein